MRLLKGSTLNRRAREIRERCPYGTGNFMSSQTTGGVILQETLFGVGLIPPPDATPDEVAEYDAANVPHPNLGQMSGGGRPVVPPDSHYRPDGLYFVGRRTAQRLRLAARNTQLAVGSGGGFRSSSAGAVTVVDTDDGTGTPTAYHRTAMPARYPRAEGAELLRETAPRLVIAGHNTIRKCGPTGTAVGIHTPGSVDITVALEVTNPSGETGYIIDEPGLLQWSLAPDDPDADGIWLVQIMVITTFAGLFSMQPSITGITGGELVSPTEVQIDDTLRVSYGEDDGGTIESPGTSYLLVMPPTVPVLSDPSTWVPVLGAPFVISMPDSALQVSVSVDSADWFRGLP